MTANSVELWGGIECTCNRVGDEYHDQFICSGHEERLEDLQAVASLGLKRLRYGLLWERHDHDPDWTWSDTRLKLLKRHGIQPILGLVHHGSGPRHTDLLDPCFAEKLAAYAGEVARRYPWIDAYTPINEPNTTARFSARYGIWYPHHRSLHSYLIVLLHQLRATVLAMEAIRSVQPAAQLVQTEDMGQIWSTPELESERQILEHRRWLTYDLLCGQVDEQHPLFRYMRAAGIPEREILWFLDHPCPPDILGINYYVTSERFLDHRVQHYPPSCGSIEGPYVDVEAVRVRPEGIGGFQPLLEEVWRRYHLPVAITEVHLGDRPEEQIRWFAQAWNAAQHAASHGIDCRAVTAWALLGSYHWDVLVTHRSGTYEPGAFDVSNGTPRLTPLGSRIERLARGEAIDHPALSSPGWWQRDDRILHHPTSLESDVPCLDQGNLVR